MTTERISAIKKFQNSDAKVRFNSVVYCSVKERVLIDNPVWPLKRPVASELEAVYPKGVLGSRTPGSPLLCAGVGSYLNNEKLGPPEALPCRRRNLHSSLASPKRCPAWWLAVPHPDTSKSAGPLWSGGPRLRVREVGAGAHSPALRAAGKRVSERLAACLSRALPGC